MCVSICCFNDDNENINHDTCIVDTDGNYTDIND